MLIENYFVCTKSGKIDLVFFGFVDCQQIIFDMALPKKTISKILKESHVGSIYLESSGGFVRQQLIEFSNNKAGEKVYLIHDRSPDI